MLPTYINEGVYGYAVTNCALSCIMLDAHSRSFAEQCVAKIARSNAQQCVSVVGIQGSFDALCVQAMLHAEVNDVVAQFPTDRPRIMPHTSMHYRLPAPPLDTMRLRSPGAVSSARKIIPMSCTT